MISKVAFVLLGVMFIGSSYNEAKNIKHFNVMEIAKVQPEQLCKKAYLCENKALAHVVKHDDPCTVCHNVVCEVVTKLDDPDAQLEIIQVLIKGCNQIGNFSHQCKRLVLEYGPIILLNAEKFFERTDVCAAIHACKAHQIAAIEQKPLPSAAAAVAAA